MRFLTVLAVLSLFACKTPPKPDEKPAPAKEVVTVSETSAEKLQALADDYWNFLMWASPTWASQIGDRRYETELPHYDAGMRAATRHTLTGFKAKLAAIDRAKLTEGESITAELLDLELDRSLSEEEFGFHRLGVDQLYGPQVWFNEIGNYHPVDADGLKTFLERVARFPVMMRQYTDNLREGLADGVVAPKIVVERVIPQVAAIAETPIEEFPLLKLMLDRLAKEEPSAQAVAEFRTALTGIIANKIVPAYKAFGTFLKDQYLPAARTNVGLVGPGGLTREAYNHRIWYHTSVQMDADELHNLGMEVLRELEGQMQQIADRMGFTGSLKEFGDWIRNNPDNFYTDAAGIVADAEKILAEADGKLPEFFGTVPKTDCIVKEIEEFRAKDAPAAYYYPPPDDLSKPGTYYVNTFEPTTRSRYNMPALSAHEAVPGHHLQIALAKEVDGLPQFRRNTGVTAFVEGWALYTELLADEMGLYKTDLEKYGMLTYQAWRASRLVVDTGMHAKGWSREQAIGFMKDHVALSVAEIENEIDRYIVWPGQALAYMVGRIEIQRIRRKAEERLGRKFDIKSFHDTMLRNGAIPLSVLQKVMDHWIDDRDSGI